MKRKILNFVILGALATVVACSNTNQQLDNDYPKSRDEIIEERVGKLTGDGIVLIGGKRKAGASADGINVNSYLWRASLDTVHIMPVVSADPFGGTIITDWYKLAENSNDRYKLNIYILANELRSDAVRVSVFKQKMDKNGWHDLPMSQEMAAEIEEKILLRARELKYRSEN